MKKTKELKAVKSLQALKGMEERDWRGIIALLIIVGGFIIIPILVILNNVGASAGIMTLMYAVTDWYFKHKKEHENRKNEK